MATALVHFESLYSVSCSPPMTGLVCETALKLKYACPAESDRGGVCVK